MKRLALTHNHVFSDKNFAQRYARHHQNMTEKFGHEITKKLHATGFQKGRIIDVGCGAGGTAIVLAQSFPDCEVFGIDLSEPLLTIATASATAANLSEQVKFEKADVQHIPLANNNYDVAINLNMVHSVEHPFLMINEIERILKPDGFLFIADLRRSWLGIIEKEIKSALNIPEARELFDKSNLRKGVFTSELIWWRFEA